jgi:TetR/AcrR family fatty acid metabolism transcriptional regulator
MTNENAERARCCIVDAARKLFARFGLGKTTVEEIAREAGYSKATVYNYFAGKEKIIVGVVEVERRLLLEKVKEAVADAPGPVESLQTFFRTRVKQIQRMHVQYRPGEEDMKRAMPHVVRSIEAHRREEQSLLEEILKSGIEQGVFRPIEDIALTAEILFVTAVGITFPFLGKKIGPVLPRLEAFLHMTMRGLCSEQGYSNLSQGETK